MSAEALKVSKCSSSIESTKVQKCRSIGVWKWKLCGIFLCMLAAGANTHREVCEGIIYQRASLLCDSSTSNVGGKLSYCTLSVI